MHYVKKTFGIVLCMCAFGIPIVTEQVNRSIQPFFIALFFLCITGAILLLKKPRQLNRRLLKTYTSSTENDTESDFVTVQTEYTPDFPKYENENTDIPATAYIRDKNGNVIRRLDSEPLNDADCAYLVRDGYERAKIAMQESNNPKFHRTFAERELEYKFVSRYGEQSDKICDTFLSIADQVYNADTIDEKLNLLYLCVDAFEKAKSWHYKKSKGAMLWFQDNWEHCHNSRNSCFSWINSELEYIKTLRYQMNTIIPWILENSVEGFLQTDIYKAFPNDDRALLRQTIDYVAGRENIEKVKQGRTYFIKSVNKEDNATYEQE